jgi:uncharacterized protein
VLAVDWSGNFHTFSPYALGIDIPEVGAALGNVHTDRWRDVASSDRVVRLSEKLEAGIDECRRSCEYFAYCGGGFYASKWAEHRTFVVAETMACRFSMKAVFDEYLAVFERSASDASAGTSSAPEAERSAPPQGDRTEVLA